MTAFKVMLVFGLLLQPVPEPAVLANGSQEYCPGLQMTLYGSGSDVVLFVQGGAWAATSRGVGAAYMAIADGGLRLAIIDLPAGAPAQFNAVACAIEYLKDNGAQRIGIVGKSSGGHIAALAGLTLDVNLAVVISAPLDLSYGCKPDRATTSFGLDCGSDALLAYSPLHRVSSKWHPTFLVIHGSNDGVVPKAHAQRFVSKMDEVGAKAVLRIYGGGHEGLYVEDVVEFFLRIFG